MKKKYFAPEMEELELDEPVVMSEQEASVGGGSICTSNECSSFTVPD